MILLMNAPKELCAFMRFLLLIYLLIPLSVSGQIRINEVVSSNYSTLPDGDNDYSDWIELYNPTQRDIELTGMYLSDDDKKLNKWTFAYAVIPANGYFIVWASGKDKVDIDGFLHTNFSISADGEELILTDPDGTIADSLIIPAMSRDVSYARVPDGAESWLISNIPTPGFSNIYSENVRPPVFSHRGGFYKQGFNLDITHVDPEAVILYTLDGSDPVIENVSGLSYEYKNRYRELPINPNGGFTTDIIKTEIYSNRIEIKNRTSNPINVGAIPSTYQFVQDYVPSNTQSVFKGTVVKARAYKGGVGYSTIVVNTYFVEPGGRSVYPLPVISLSTSKAYLFDYNKGVYVAGVDFDDWRRTNPLTPANPSVGANYQRRGEEWEYPIQFEYFEKNDTISAINQSLGFRMHGGWTRADPQKTFRLYARKEYGTSNLNHRFFENVEQEEFKRLLLKSTYNYRVTDAVSQELVRHLNFPTQNSTYAVVFLNGEYWGLQEIKERFDKNYLEKKYGIDPDNIDYLNNESGVDEGDNIDYNNMLRQASSNSMAIQSEYEAVAKKIDLENYTDYYAAEIYLGNKDWPHNNIDYWRVRTDSIMTDVPYGHDGKWRWLMYDMDLAMNGVADVDSFAHNTLEWASRNHSSTVLFRNLILNRSFSNRLVNRLSDLMNTTFLPERTKPLIENQKNYIVQFFPEHLKRWPSISGGMARFNSTFDRMIQFAANRSQVVRNHLRGKFQLIKEVSIQLDISHRNSLNYIRINTIDIHHKTVGVSERPYPWTGIYFDGVPVEITAVPAYGYEFSHWEGMPEGTPASFTKNFDSNSVLVAHFIRTIIPEYSLRYSSGEGGYLAGDSIQIIEEGNNGTSVTAIPEEGYEFLKWSDGHIGNPRTDMNIQADLSVQALFNVLTSVKNETTLTTSIYPNPVKDILTIKKSQPGTANFTVYHILGQQVMSGEIPGNLYFIDTRQLPDAVYILWIEDGKGQRFYHKFVKN